MYKYKNVINNNYKIFSNVQLVVFSHKLGILSFIKTLNLIEKKQTSEQNKQKNLNTSCISFFLALDLNK